MAAPTSVEEYLAALPKKSRAALDKLRKRIRAAAPTATETISYQMPAFKDHGRFLVSYAAFKEEHCSLFPASEAVIEALGEELKPYFSEKGKSESGRQPGPALHALPVDVNTACPLGACDTAWQVPHYAAENRGVTTNPLPRRGHRSNGLELALAMAAVQPARPTSRRAACPTDQPARVRLCSSIAGSIAMAGQASRA